MGYSRRDHARPVLTPQADDFFWVINTWDLSTLVKNHFDIFGERQLALLVDTPSEHRTVISFIEAGF
jgi:hypothetical protein